MDPTTPAVGDDLTAELAAGNGHSEVPDGSVLAQLRAQRERLRTRDPVTLPIPGYDGLHCRYQAIPWELYRKLVGRLTESKDQRADVNTAADVLIRACEQFYFEKDGSLQPLNEVLGLGDDPVRYDKQLAEVFEIEFAKARDVLFGLIPNEFALDEHFGEYNSWLRSTNVEADEEFLGE